MGKVFDSIIIGGGPAGLTAALYAARKKMDILVLTNDIGGQVLWSGSIENYLGHKKETGFELRDKFFEHVNDYGVDIREEEPVESLEKVVGKFRVRTGRGEYFAKTVIAATGRQPRELGVEGEKEFRSKGVVYCATCDAPLFYEQDVLIVGGGNSAFDSALQLTEYAKTIYIADIADKLIADSIMVKKVQERGKAHIFNSTMVKKIFGNDFVEGVILTTNSVDTIVEVQGVFIEIGSLPVTDYIKCDVKKTEGVGDIVVNHKCETDVEGLYCCGDMTNVFAKQIVIASGEGAKAAIAAYEYLSKH